ncbi:DUF6222 family protein [Actinophytocola algeriensis]|jgi:hypothetical protein|uniref:Uncharacterized protein n=1 Tax=Actinophytocola algeriensis TaxID=1768010 RepID=A0A7W7VGT9_9PSEU|nr:DUF6222 family protein [Actinophytocola algeriensis]MBB4909390.1 hypothetical protein [Actinophytocola algeriensis]MBE1475380.1 hypothetical protein [Actinophytocola algeriensis]
MSGTRANEPTPITQANFGDEEPERYIRANLARGIVWADILADIAADEQARQQLRDAA